MIFPPSKVAVAVTSSFAGGCLLVLSSLENAMQKQAAWAAARSSSGLVLPPGASVLDAQVTPASVNSPLLRADTVPLPSKRLPCHVALAERSAIAASWGVGIRSARPYRFQGYP